MKVRSDGLEESRMKYLRYLSLISLTLILSKEMNAQNKTDGKPYVIAHRGASGYAPENTLASFKKALEIGEDMVELDVHLSKDQKLVVIHDETIDRTTDMS